MKSPKSKNRSISLPIELLVEADAKAYQDADGNFSNYVKNLIEKDLQKSPALPQTREKILENLAEKWTPSFSDTLQYLLEKRGVSQIETLARFLAKFHDYLAAQQDCAPADFILIPEKQSKTYADYQHEHALLELQKARLETHKKPTTEIEKQIAELRKKLDRCAVSLADNIDAQRPLREAKPSTSPPAKLGARY